MRREADKTPKTQKKLLDKQTDCVLIEKVDVDEDQRGKTPLDEAFKRPNPPKSWFQVKTEEKVGNKKNIVQDRRSILEQMQKKQLSTKPADGNTKKTEVANLKKLPTPTPVENKKKPLTLPEPSTNLSDFDKLCKE